MTGTLRPAEPADAHEIHRVAVASSGPHEEPRAEVGRRRSWRLLSDTSAELEAGGRLGPLTPFTPPGALR